MDMKTWMKELDVMTNKRGLLWQYIETLPTEHASHAQLKRMVNKWRPMIQEFNSLKPEHESILRRLADREACCEAMSRSLETERALCDQINTQLMAKRKECHDLQMQLRALTNADQ
jgi:hypothetical protein